MLGKVSAYFGSSIASLEECLFHGLDHLQFDLRDKMSLWLILKPTEMLSKCFVYGDLFHW